MIPPPRILVVEDEPHLMFVVKACLAQKDFRVLEAADGARGLELALAEKPALVVLDVGLPEMSGLEVCRRLRELQFEQPILMLTSRSQLDDRVTGLEAGADDYLAKPFEPRELLARINALLRRGRREENQNLVVDLGDVHIDFARKQATRAGAPLSLTKTEFALLELFAKNAGHPVTRENLLDIVWGYTRFPSTRTVDTHIWRLRKKLGDDGENPRWIRRVHGEGYVLTLEQSK